MGKYSFNVDKLTIERLSSLSSSQWLEIAENILNGKSISINIDFTESNSLLQFRELFDLLVTHNIDASNYSEALIHLLVERYKRIGQISQKVILVKAIEYIRPSRWFKLLESLILSEEYFVFSDEVDEDGLKLKYHLINAVMIFDQSENLIYSFLQNLSNEHQDSEYYQVTLRYIYIYKSLNDFLSFMARIESHDLTDNDIFYIESTLHESVLDRKSFKLVYYYLCEEKETKLKAEIKESIEKWISFDVDLYKTFLYFSPVISFFDIFYLSGEKELFICLNTIIKMDEYDLINKYQLLRHIGVKLKNIGIEIFFPLKENIIENFFSLKVGSLEISIQMDKHKEWEYIQLGYSQATKFSNKEASRIPDSLIQKST